LQLSIEERGGGIKSTVRVPRAVEGTFVRKRRCQKADSSVKINATLVNPFVEAAKVVVKQITGTEARRGHISYRTAPEARFGVSIIIGVHGHHAGQVVYNMKTEVAEKLVEMMRPDKPLQVGTKLFSDAIGEFANMITARALCLLNEGKEPAVETEKPAVVTGNQLDVDLAAAPTLVIGLHTPCGQVEINVALGSGDEANEHGEHRRHGGGR
jgi:chemotaxis protein CheX